MTFWKEHRFSRHWNLFSGFGSVGLTLLFLLMVGLAPLHAISGTGEGGLSIVTVPIVDATHETTGILSHGPVCVTYGACLAIQPAANSLNPTEFTEWQQGLPPLAFVVWATGPPLLKPPKLS